MDVAQMWATESADTEKMLADVARMTEQLQQFTARVDDGEHLGTAAQLYALLHGLEELANKAIYASFAVKEVVSNPAE